MPRMPDPNTANEEHPNDPNADPNAPNIRGIRICIRRFVCSHGFSLMELLVAIGIFIVLSGILLANFRRGRQGDSVRLAATTFAANIQRMQALALAGGASDGGALAYGVHLDSATSDQYVLFGDHASASEGANNVYDSEGGEVLDGGVVRLPADIEISSVVLASVPAETVNVLDVVFTLPRAMVVVTPTATSATVTFRHRSSGEQKSVTINRISGQVSIE